MIALVGNHRRGRGRRPPGMRPWLSGTPRMSRPARPSSAPGDSGRPRARRSGGAWLVPAHPASTAARRSGRLKTRGSASAPRAASTDHPARFPRRRPGAWHRGHRRAVPRLAPDGRRPVPERVPWRCTTTAAWPEC